MVLFVPLVGGNDDGGGGWDGNDVCDVDVGKPDNNNIKTTTHPRRACIIIFGVVIAVRRYVHTFFVCSRCFVHILVIIFTYLLIIVVDNNKWMDGERKRRTATGTGKPILLIGPPRYIQQ